MKDLRLLLAAFLWVTYGAAGAAQSPLVKVDNNAVLHPLLHHDAYTFHVGTTPQPDETGRYTATLDLPPTESYATDIDAQGVVFGVEKRVDAGSGWRLIDYAVGPGSFSFYAGAGIYNAFVVGLNRGPGDVPYHLRVVHASPVPEPKSWAMLLLGVGFVVYQVRRRGQSPAFSTRRSSALSTSVPTPPATARLTPVSIHKPAELGPSNTEGATP
jgi:hypothetical protein